MTSGISVAFAESGEHRRFRSTPTMRLAIEHASHVRREVPSVSVPDLPKEKGRREAKDRQLHQLGATIKNPDLTAKSNLITNAVVSPGLVDDTGSVVLPGVERS